MGKDNIFWLFSSSAQSIAAFIGFITAGFYFVLSKIDSNPNQDNTLDEILLELKKKHFQKLKILCILTGFSIVLSLFMLYLNNCHIRFLNVYVILVFILNILTIGWAIYFVIDIINPDNIEKTANKLIKENKDINLPDQVNSIKIGQFLEKFIKLENFVRGAFKKLGLVEIQEEKGKSYLKLSDIFILLFQMGYITLETLSDLNEVNKIRNLAAHGQIDKIDIKYSNMLDELTEKISSLKRED